MIDGLMPHGMCFAWRPGLLALHVISDGLIALAYFSIPCVLALLARRRSDLPFRGVLWMFALFIVGCGTTHLLSIWVIWHPDYWLEGIVKSVTAVASIATALLLIPLAPQALRLRSPRELERMNAELQAALEHLRREEHIARELQVASFTPEIPKVGGVNFSASYVAANSDLVIGGDWYDAVRLADGRLAISIGDVTGSGLDAAVIMGKVRQSLRAAAYVQIDPSAMLDVADRSLRSEYPDRIVTAFLGLLDPVEQTLTFASAGHPWPLLRRANGDIVEIGRPSLPLGLRDRLAPPAEIVALGAGDLLILYTDGLVEATHDWSEGFERLFQAAQNANPLRRDLAEELRVAIAPNPRDDIAVLTAAIVEERSLYRATFDCFDARAAARVRSEMTDLLIGVGASDDDLFVSEMVYSELIGNVVRYAPGEIEVVLDTAGVLPVLHVLDRGTGFQHVPNFPRDLYSERGRGLFMTQSLTEDFHVVRRHGGGSHAYAVISLQRVFHQLRAPGRAIGMTEITPS